MNLIEKIMSWFGGKVVPLEEAQKRMPNHEPEEKEVVERYTRKVYSDGRGGMTEVVEKVKPKEITTTDETLEKIVEEKTKAKKPRKPRAKKKQPDSPKTPQPKKPRKPRKPKNNNNQSKGSTK